MASRFCLNRRQNSSIRVRFGAQGFLDMEIFGNRLFRLESSQAYPRIDNQVKKVRYKGADQHQYG